MRHYSELGYFRLLDGAKFTTGIVTHINEYFQHCMYLCEQLIIHKSYLGVNISHVPEYCSVIFCSSLMFHHAAGFAITFHQICGFAVCI